VKEFWSGEMGQERGRRWLREEGINYIYYGLFERGLSPKLAEEYHFLRKIFKNSMVEIFRAD